MEPNPYAPNTKSQRLIAEQALRELHAALQVQVYQLRVEREVAPLIGESSAQHIQQIEKSIRELTARIKAYQKIRAELEQAQEQAAQALQNGKGSP